MRIGNFDGEKCLELYWNDLTKEAQDTIINIFGENCNYDSFPIVSLPFDENDSERNDNNV